MPRSQQTKEPSAPKKTNKKPQEESQEEEEQQQEEEEEQSKKEQPKKEHHHHKRHTAERNAIKAQKSRNRGIPTMSFYATARFFKSILCKGEATKFKIRRAGVSLLREKLEEFGIEFFKAGVKLTNTVNLDPRSTLQWRCVLGAIEQNPVLCHKHLLKPEIKEEQKNLQRFQSQRRQEKLMSARNRGLINAATRANKDPADVVVSVAVLPIPATAPDDVVMTH